MTYIPCDQGDGGFRQLSAEQLKNVEFLNFCHKFSHFIYDKRLFIYLSVYQSIEWPGSDNKLLTSGQLKVAFTMSLEVSTPWGDGDVATSRKNSVYFDEEDLLGYKIWVAELELLVSQQKQQVGGGSGGFPKVDFGACYILLQKLHATIDKTNVEEIKMYQRRCEDALIDILLKGAPPPVCFCETVSFGWITT